MRIGGIASGLDVESMVQGLMRAERIPLDRLVQKRQVLEWQRDEFRSMNLALSKFRDSYSKMRLQSTFNIYQGKSANENVAGATAYSTAMAGTYDLEVHSIAKVATVRSNPILRDPSLDPATPKAKASDNIFQFVGRSADDGSFTFKIKLDNNDARVVNLTITEDDTFASMAEKVSKLTYSSGGFQVSAGLRASFDNTTGTFMISTKDMGAAKQIEFVEPDAGTPEHAYWSDLFQVGGDGSTSSPVGTGQDARITFDGMEITGLNSNTVNVHGIGLELINTGTSTITVSSNPDQVYDVIKDFVDSYNELIDLLQGKITEPRYKGFPPLTQDMRSAMSEKEAELWEEKARSGMLRNDPILNAILFDMRRAFSDPVSGMPAGNINQLAQIGITTGHYRDGGRLFINENTLRNAIANKPDEVLAFFTKDAGDGLSSEQRKQEIGIGRRLYEELNNTIGRLRDHAGFIGVEETQSSMAKSLSQVNKEITRVESRLSRIENQYWRQFTAFEKVMDNLNKQSQYLMQTLLGNPNG